MYSSARTYHSSRIGAAYNDALATDHFGELYNVGRIRNTAWQMERLGNKSQEYRPYVIQARASRERPDHASLLAISRAAGGALLLITVMPHELMHAVEWLTIARQAQAASWFHAHYLFVTLDQETYDALEAANPGYALLEDMTGWPRPPTALSWKSFDRLCRLRAMPLAIITATMLFEIEQTDDGFTAYSVDTTTCSAAIIRSNGELFSIQAQTGAGMALWRLYRSQGGKGLEATEGVCWI